MPNLPYTRERESKARHNHNSLKWLLTLLSAVITTGLVALLNDHL
jgi:uncharacterized membrane-anchored protein